MFKSISRNDFHNEFVIMGRQNYFNPEAKDALFDYLENYEESSGEKVELDIVTLCHDFREDKIEEVLKNYDLESIEDLEDNTNVVWANNERVLYLVY